MPIVVDLAVEKGRIPASPAVLRGLLGQLITDPPGQHGSGYKPYRAGQLMTSADRNQSWRLAWLREAGSPSWVPREPAGAAGAGGQWPTDPPWPALADGVEFTVNDGTKVLVRESSRSEISYAELWQLPECTEILMEFRSPVYFRRSARKTDGENANPPRRTWPLPDPVLVFDSLRETWKQCAPPELAIEPELLRDLLDYVQLRGFSGGTRAMYPAAKHAALTNATNARPRGDRVGSSKPDWENAVGFVGRAKFGLPRSAPPDVVRCFTSLAQFAAYAGVGAQRTYGFGDVLVHPANQ